MLRKFVSWITVFFWMYLIFWLSSKPKVIPAMRPLFAYTVSSFGHLLFYAILYFLLYGALNVSFALAGKRIFLLSLVVVLLYGMSDEYHQSFIPGRDASIIDVGFDLLGGLVARMLQKTHGNTTVSD